MSLPPIACQFVGLSAFQSFSLSRRAFTVSTAEIDTETASRSKRWRCSFRENVQEKRVAESIRGSTYLSTVSLCAETILLKPISAIQCYCCLLCAIHSTHFPWLDIFLLSFYLPSPCVIIRIAIETRVIETTNIDNNNNDNKKEWHSVGHKEGNI